MFTPVVRPVSLCCAETNPQEVMDLSPVAHLATIEGKVPFINFFDGFRTSHEIQKIEKWDYADLKEMCNMDAVAEFRAHALNPEHPAMRGSHENGDVFFQHREACNTAYNELPAIVEKYMEKVNEKLGTNYESVQLLRSTGRRARYRSYGFHQRRS